ncbi:MAG: TRAP transporter substrate-binding protein [Thermodesulfobacteriota bacterium]
MKNRSLLTVVSILSVLAVLIAAHLSEAAEATKDKPLVLRFNTVTKSEGAPGSAGQQVFKKELEKLTDGRVKVQYYFGWTLANNTEAVVGGLQSGGFEVSDWGLGTFAEYSKAFLPIDVPYLITRKEVAYDIIRGETGRMMTDRFLKDTGIKVLKISHLGFRHITNSKRPITSPADLKGLKIRTQPNPLHLQGFKAFGASPTPMAFAELFTALQQGVVDGQENPIYNIIAMRLHEVQKYMSLTYHLWNAGGFIMSDKYYKSLPEDIRTAVDKAAVAAREAVIEDIAKSEPGWLSEIKKKTQVTELTNDQILAFQKIAKQEWPKMASTIGKDYFNAVRDRIEKVQSKTK